MSPVVVEKSGNFDSEELGHKGTSEPVIVRSSQTNGQTRLRRISLSHSLELVKTLMQMRRTSTYTRDSENSISLPSHVEQILAAIRFASCERAVGSSS